jgi:hypothetical protein
MAPALRLGIRVIQEAAIELDEGVPRRLEALDQVPTARSVERSPQVKDVHGRQPNSARCGS